jgi:ATP synthase protein I
MARSDKPDRTAAEEAELARRLRNLDRRLDEERAAEQQAQAPRGMSVSMPGVARALRLAADFIAGILLGVALGWVFDRFFGTSPWGLIVWIVIGFVGGTLNMARSAGLVKPGPLGPGPDDPPQRGE